MPLNDWGMGLVPAPRGCGWDIQNQIATLYPYQYRFHEMLPHQMAGILDEGTNIYLTTMDIATVYLPFYFRTHKLHVLSGKRKL